MLGRVILVAAIVASATPAAADTPAEQAFGRGRDALQVGKYVEACAEFEDSQRLDPQPTTQFNIALCEEQLGKLASALAIYKQLSLSDDNPARRAKDPEKVTELESRVARLKIELSVAAPPGLQITINGVRAIGTTGIPIDLGLSRVVVQAPGFATWTGQISAKDERQLVDLAVTLVPDPAAAVPVVRPPPPLPPPPRHERSPRRIYAVVAIAGGGAAIAGSVIAGVLARNAWLDAKAVCSGTVCDSPALLAQGQALADTAHQRGTIATVLAVGGVALVAGGVVLWVTAPKAERSVAIAPSASRDGAGVSLLGAF